LLGGAPRFVGSPTSSHPTVKDHLVIAYDVNTPTNIPLEIAYHLSGYVKTVVGNGTLDGSMVVLVNGALAGLTDTLANFERILRTPIPLSYAAHLYHILGIYLLSLPFQLVNTLEWYTIPCLAFTGFCLLGILQIGWEIENPFGYDDNDLVNFKSTYFNNACPVGVPIPIMVSIHSDLQPLDDFCWTIRHEVEQITCTKFHDADEWILSKENQPLVPYSQETATDLSNEALDVVLKKFKEAGVMSTEKFKTRKEWEKEQKKRK